MTRAAAGLLAAFVSLGATAAAIPAVLPAAGAAMRAELLDAVPALFGGLLIGVIVSGPVMRVVRPVRVLMAGCLLQAAGLVAIAFSSSPGVFIASSALAGVGFGLSEASGTVLAKRMGGAHGTATRLSVLTGAVAIAAACTPVLVLVASKAVATQSVLLGVAVVPLAAASLLVSSASSDAAPDASRDAHPRPRLLMLVRRVSPRSYIALLLFATALPIYVGVETVFAGWSAELPARMLDLDSADASIGTSIFWVLMATGRYVAVVVTRTGRSARVVLVAGSLIGAVALAAAGVLAETRPAWALVAISIAVIAIAPSYGIIAGLALDRLSDRSAGDALGPLVACGALGGVAVPLLVVSVASDPASSVTFAICGALLLVVAILVAATDRIGAAQHANDRGRR